MIAQEKREDKKKEKTRGEVMRTTSNQNFIPQIYHSFIKKYYKKLYLELPF